MKNGLLLQTGLFIVLGLFIRSLVPGDVILSGIYWVFPGLGLFHFGIHLTGKILDGRHTTRRFWRSTWRSNWMFFVFILLTLETSAGAMKPALFWAVELWLGWEVNFLRFNFNNLFWNPWNSTLFIFLLLNYLYVFYAAKTDKGAPVPQAGQPPSAAPKNRSNSTESPPKTSNHGEKADGAQGSA